MMLKKRIVSVAAIVLCCKMFILPVTPAYAICWPVISGQAVAAFTNTVTTGLAAVGVSQAEIDNYTKTIHSIGDQVSSIAKYVDDLSQSIESIRHSVDEVMKNLIRSAKDMDAIMAEANGEMEKAEKEKKDTAEKTVKDVEEETKTQESVDPAIVDDYIEENRAQDERMNVTFQEAEDKVNALGESSNDNLRSLQDVVDQSSISEEDKANMTEAIKEAKEKMDQLTKESLELLDKMKKDYGANSEAILSAYDDYRQAIEDYNAGKISKEALEQKGNDLKERTQNAQGDTDYTKELSDLSTKIENYVQEMNDLQESILDYVANNKDYPDDAMINILDAPQKYVFNFHQENAGVYSKGCYATKGSKGCKLYTLKKGDKSFLISKEFTAQGARRTSTDPNGQCQKLTFEDLEKEHQDWFLAKFRDCVTRANTEKTYFFPEIGSEEELAKENPYEEEPLFKPYEKKGVYRHIAEDYAAANIINANQTKQYARSWLGTEADGKEATGLNLFIREFDQIENTRDAYNLLGAIELEYLEMYSQMRRVEAINYAKRAVDIYRPLPKIYIDGRFEHYVDANNNPNKNDVPKGAVKEKVCQKRTNCDEKKVITVISNVFPYLCQKDAYDFSLKYEDKNDRDKMDKVEEKIVECIKTYVEPATNGTIEGKIKTSPDEVKKIWQENIIKAMTDSMYHTLSTATINLYRTSKERALLANEKDTNIASITKDAKDSKSSRNDYSACAKISEYGAHQLLTIVDADAQAIQSEILSDMRSVSFDFFPDIIESGDE